MENKEVHITSLLKEKYLFLDWIMICVEEAEG